MKTKAGPTDIGIDTMIHTVRGTRIMLDSDLARIYGVQTRVFNQALKRNMSRFPEDLCFSSRAKRLNRFCVQDHKM
jgi:hypothetical protein